MGLLSKFSNIPVSFGGASISGEAGGYGFGDVSLEASRRILEYAFENGIRIFDSAPIYGFGESEKRLGKVFKDIREQVFIISKSGVHWHPNKRVDMTNDPKIAQKMLEQSLRDLDSDYIDLYMVHWPDENVDIRKTLEVYHKAKEEGKVKYIGLCNTNIVEIEKAKEIDRIDVVQSQHNFFEKQDDDFLDYLQEEDISFMSWGTFDKGIITGSVKKSRTFDKSDCRSWAPWWKASNKDQKIDVMQTKVLPFLERNGHTGLEFALAHNLKDNKVSSLLCGGKTVDQWESIFKSLQNLPNDSLLEECIKLKEF